MADTTTSQDDKPEGLSAENSDPTKITAAEHKDAVKVVSGQVTAEQEIAEKPKVLTTRDLPSEMAKDAKLDEEVAQAQGEAEEREQLYVRTLANGKTEAVLAAAPPLNQFPPDDGGYNPEKRTHAGPGGTKVPSAVGKNRTTPNDVPVGWKPEHKVK